MHYEWTSAAHLGTLRPAFERPEGVPELMAVHIHLLRPVVAIVTFVIIGCGTSATPTTTLTPYSPPPATVTPVVPPPPIATATATAGPESSLLAAMTATFGACAIKAPPSGAVVVQVDCTTRDLVSVSVTEYKTAAATAAAFKAQAGATPGSRCSAGTYLGTYRAAGRIVGQLGCDGTYVTVAWTVPVLRLYFSATGGSMPWLYTWWQHHWTTSPGAGTATTGEKPVPIPTAPPEPTIEPDAAEVYPATPADIRFNQTWTKSYATTTCGDWNLRMTAEQRWTMAADLLYAARAVSDLPPDDLITTFGEAISADCIPTGDLKVTEVAAALYELSPDVYGP
jgi:hypothetical protein